MDGTFKEWDEQGKLVGQYEMTKGTGRKRVYYLDGILQTEENIQKNERNGRVITLFSNGQIDYLGEFQDGWSKGLGISFNENGTLDYVAWSKGPLIYFDENGLVKKKIWLVYGTEVTEANYAKVAQSDPTLPPYYKDATRYKDFVTPDINALVQMYRIAPRVKIPLEFDNKGEPVLAPPRQATEGKKP